jgi:hypothetical protein
MLEPSTSFEFLLTSPDSDIKKKLKEKQMYEKN